MLLSCQIKQGYLISFLTCYTERRETKREGGLVAGKVSGGGWSWSQLTRQQKSLASLVTVVDPDRIDLALLDWMCIGPIGNAVPDPGARKWTKFKK